MNGIDRCVWLSIRPGSTKHPVASTTSAPSGAATRPTAATFSPSIRTSPSNSPSAATTVPLAIRMVWVMARFLLSCGRDPHVLRERDQHVAEPPGQVLQERSIADQRGRDLYHRVAAVVTPGDQLGTDQRAGQALAQELFSLLGIETGLGPVRHELDRPEVAAAADVADDRQPPQRLELAGQVTLVLADVVEYLLALEQLEVLQRDRGRQRMAAEGDPMQQCPAGVVERSHDSFGRQHRSHRRVG